MAKGYVAVRLDQELIDRLDRLAEKEGTTRTEVVEQALRRGLESEEKWADAVVHPIYGTLVGLMTSEPMMKAMMKWAESVGEKFEPNLERVALIKNMRKQKKGVAPKHKSS